MLGEHGKYNDALPYYTSAGVPFLIRWPEKIKKGKVVNTAFSSPDFAPTILSLMDIDHSYVEFQGIDGSMELINKKKKVTKKRVRFITDSKSAHWAAARDRQYKLVVSRGEVPFLFCLLYTSPSPRD